MSCRLERPDQGRAGPSFHHNIDIDRFRPCGLGVCTPGGRTGHARLAVDRDLGCDPPHLFCVADREYRTGDLGQVYPIARGSAPLMTAAATTLFVGEPLTAIGWAGIVSLVAGVLL